MGQVKKQQLYLSAHIIVYCTTVWKIQNCSIQKRVMANCRMHILEEAFKLFLVNNVEKVTISELEKATQKVRGTIFYHFNDKQRLFEYIIDEIFLPQLDMSPQINDMPLDVSFAKFIESYKSPEERAIDIIREKYHIPNAEKCYFNFLSQAYKYSPDFQKRYAQVFDKEKLAWKVVIDKYRKSDFFIDSNSYILADIVMLFKTGVSYSKGHLNMPGIDYNKTLSKLYSYLLR